MPLILVDPIHVDSTKSMNNLIADKLWMQYELAV